MTRTGQSQTEFGSWKEIAAYLGVTVRTAQKWEAERGLPVRRLPGPRGRVSAERAAIDLWREATLAKPSWWANLSALRVYATATTALLLVFAGMAVGFYLGGNRKGPPASFRHDLSTLIVADSRGRELWRHAFEDPFHSGDSPEALLSTGRA